MPTSSVNLGLNPFDNSEEGATFAPWPRTYGGTPAPTRSDAPQNSSGYQVPTRGHTPTGLQHGQQGNRHDLTSSHGSYQQGQEPTFRIGGDTTCGTNYGSMVDIQGHRSNSHGHYVSAPPVLYGTASGSQFSYPLLNPRESQWKDPGPAYDFSNFVYRPEGTVGCHTYGTDDNTYGVRGYDGDALSAEVATYSSTSQVTSYGLDGAASEREDGRGDFSYDLVPHAIIQGANTMCFRTQRRMANCRSGPYSIVNRQERNRGTICNGNIYGGVNHFTMSNSDGVILQYLKEHAATGAVHDSDERFPPPLCHPRTRGDVIYRVLNWYGYQCGPEKPIMWVHAPAGYGKTAVAGTVAEKLEEKLIELGFNPLGATFFFWRTSPERNSPARFIITLAYQLFVSIPELAPHIEDAVKRNPMILTKALEVQMKKLIVEPFKALEDIEGKPNRLIIVDGLDECINSDRESRIENKYAEHQESAQIRVLDLIYALVSHQLPLSFLILSRPEAWIKQHLESRRFKGVVEFVDLYKVGDHLQDVETFVRAKLSELGLDEEDLVTGLVDRAGGHMLYASTIIRHIDNPYGDPRARLQNILNSDDSHSNPDIAHSTPFSSLHELYKQIMRSCPEGTRSCMIEVLEDILGPDLSGFNAHRVDVGRAVSTLDALSGRVPGTGMKAIRGLNGVLKLCNDHNDRKGNKSQRLEFFVHSSFREFLLDPRLSLEFHIDRQRGRRRLLSGCLNHMSSISLDSKLDEDHLRYAVVEWEWVWFDWVSNVPKPDGAMLSAMFQKLLEIDLTSCFSHAFTCRHLEEVVYEARLSFDTLVKGYGNPLIPSNLLLYDIDSNPLAQPAVTHVRACCEAAILQLLDAYHPYTNHYNPSFYFLTFLSIHNLIPGEVPAEAWSSKKVVCALKRLKQGSTEHFHELTGELRGKVTNIADILDIDMEDIESAIASI